MVEVAAYSRGGGLLTICSFRLGAYSRGGLFEGGENSRIYSRWKLLSFSKTVRDNIKYNSHIKKKEKLESTFATISCLSKFMSRTA